MIRSPAGFDGGDRIKRYLDYYQPSYGVMMLSAGQFSPAQLFAQGEQGAWYDPSDFSTMFQDSAGTTPVTAVQQPVGLILDKSQGLAIGSELISPINFTTGWSSSGAAVTFDSASTFTAAGIANVFRVLVEIGKWYKITFNISFTSAGLNVYNATTASNLINSGTIASGTSYTYYFLAAATQINFRPTSAGAVTVNSVTLTAIAGNHASQSTSTSRPTLSARVNLLTYSEQFDNAAWTKGGQNAFGSGSVANTTATTDPLGGNTADFLQESTANSAHNVSFATGYAAGSYTFSCAVKAAGRTFVAARVSVAAGGGEYAYAVFNLSTGAIAKAATIVGTLVTAASASISALGGDWYRITLTHTSATAFNFGPAIVFCTSANPTLTSFGSETYTGDGTSGIYIWGADLRSSTAGATLPTYQRIAAATDYDTTGFPYYLSFDGTDDFLVTGTINPGSVDKAQIFAGVRKLSDAAAACVAELSATGVSNAGTFTILAPQSGGNYYFRSRGSVAASGATAVTYTAPITNVLTGLGDISADSNIIRVNGVASTTDATDQGTGNYLSYPLYIGRRGGSTIPFNGNIYSLIVRFGPNLDTTTISSTETWVNGKTGAY